MAGQKGRSGGHNRKPTKLKLLEGTFRKDRANPDEPRLENAIPKPSYNLPNKAKKEYKNLTEILNTMGILTEADGIALERLAVAIAECKWAEKELFKQIKPDEIRIWQLILKDARKFVASMLPRFGLTPADRSRVSKIPEKPPENKWSNL